VLGDPSRGVDAFAHPVEERIRCRGDSLVWRRSELVREPLRLT
jgi:hypothetical protein